MISALKVLLAVVLGTVVILSLNESLKHDPGSPRDSRDPAYRTQ